MLLNDFAYPKLMKYFEEISAIPRGSYNEKAIADYICEFAKTHGYEYYRDDVNNVLINAPATEGMEDVPALLLQGHTDMVCEKNEGVEHDFEVDGLDLYEEDGWLRARGTTLGADDGYAVAIMLYVLDGGVERHGAIQCLFTASEEVGLDGVKAMDYSKIFARRMLNMDSADDSIITAGCAGGQRSSLTFDARAEVTVAPVVAKIMLKGLAGGHSGEDIDKGRANANKLMGRVLDSINVGRGTKLVSVNGGSKENAIPRECQAVVIVDDLDALCAKVKELEAELKEGLSKSDSALSVTVSLVDKNCEVEYICDEDATKILFFIRCVGVGVFDMNHSIKGIVEWSRNLGVVKCAPNSAEMVLSSRSSISSRIDASEQELDFFVRMLGAKARHYNRYPGWNFAPVSDLRDTYVKAFEAVTGYKPEITVIHAGLESGFVSQAVPDMDIISCGPIVRDLHSPDEKMNIESYERFFTVVKKVIEE